MAKNTNKYPTSKYLKVKKKAKKWLRTNSSQVRFCLQILAGKM